MRKETSIDDPSDEMLAAIEADLQSSLESIEESIDPRIQEMVRYHLGWSNQEQSSGKRIRPLLTLLCCQAAGGDWHQALPAATAIEWIHNFSLIHDDIQDQSELRRGRPAVWKVWGTAQAINTGDAIFALSRLSTQRMTNLGVPAEDVINLHRILDAACLSLTNGQHLDIAFEGSLEISTDEYLKMIHGKTASLLGAACRSGSSISPASPEAIDSFSEFGEHLGMAFQVIDDLLGVWGESAETGKSSADDLRMRKKTLPIIHGLENSSTFRELWSSQSISEEKIETMRQILGDTRSQRFTTSCAVNYTDQATAALIAAEPLEPAASALSSLAARLLQRVA